MVKRLNVGRAAESGVVSASLAEEDFTGPNTVLEGEGGFLRAFCPTFDPKQLTLSRADVRDHEHHDQALCVSHHGSHTGGGDLAYTVTVSLKDGQVFSQHVTAFSGTPQRPPDRAGLREKFMLVTADQPAAAMAKLFDRLQNLESEEDLRWLSV